MTSTINQKEVIYKKIRDEITYGSLHPGEKIPELRMAKEIGCSRTPIREALRYLEKEGYITLIPHRGTFVSKISPRDVEEIYDITTVLEGFAVYIMVKQIKNLKKNDLRKILEKLKTLNDEMKYFCNTTDFQIPICPFHYFQFSDLFHFFQPFS